MNKFIKSVGSIDFYGANGVSTEMRKAGRGGEEFSRFNPSSIESIEKAAKYVGATK